MINKPVTHLVVVGRGAFKGQCIWTWRRFSSLVAVTQRLSVLDRGLMQSGTKFWEVWTDNVKLNKCLSGQVKPAGRRADVSHDGCRAVSTVTTRS